MHKITLFACAMIFACSATAQTPATSTNPDQQAESLSRQNVQVKSAQATETPSATPKANLQNEPSGGSFAKATKVEPVPSTAKAQNAAAREAYRNKFAPLFVGDQIPAGFPAFDEGQSMEGYKLIAKDWLRNNQGDLKPEVLTNEKFVNAIK